MKSVVLAGLISIFFALVTVAAALPVSSARKPLPLFTGDRLLAPPEQHLAWTPPPSELPTNYISATRLLFDQGMADPRGCEYRVIEIGTGEVWRGDGGVIETHGWVLPDDSAQKFAVGWNGLVYPVIRVGTNADLDMDVAMLETNGSGDRGRFFNLGATISEATFVSQKSSLGLKGCFLLRLGKADLATRLWLAQECHGIEIQNEMQRRFSQTNNIILTNEIRLSVADPYFNWANDWAWTMFDRTICAHERGDEKLALATARQLAAAQPQIEAECARRGFKPQPYWDNAHRGQTQSYLTFLGQFLDLLADLERREREGPHVSILNTGATNVLDQTQRITALIHDLDLVQARQWSQPGWVDPGQDAIVSALIQEGDAAVGPLLNCVEQDKRLTQSVGFGRDFHRDRTVITVKHTAAVALKAILRADFSNDAEMRVYWNKYKNLKLQDRWYAILNDDSARARWQEAAACIVQPDNITTVRNGYRVNWQAASNKPAAMLGEILRNKSNPTVTELLVRRALEVPTNNFAAYDLSANCQFAEDLARWDAAAALPVAKTLVKRACTVMKYSNQQLGTFVAKLSIACANAGDATAFDDYADWIVTTTPEQLGYSMSDCLQPLLKFQTNPVLQIAAMKLFADTNSAWAQLPWKESSSFNPFGSGLATNAAFRVLLGRELARTNVCGTIIWNMSGQISYEITNNLNQSGSFGVTFPAGMQPTQTITNKLRWCDWIAVQLSNAKTIPFYNPFASADDRDDAIKKAKAQFNGEE